MKGSNTNHTFEDLIAKYDVPVPRYTSFPTVPFWNQKLMNPEEWLSEVRKAYQQKGTDGISLYIHLPFCESLCTYCGCNKRITKNHQVEQPYIDALIAEWQLYREVMDEKPRIKDLHLGGGTPTFFSAANLRNLIETLFQQAEPSTEPSFSFEGHPANTREEHLRVLYELGFRRASYGIQDFDPQVQKAINRYQSVEQVEELVSLSRACGYTSINFDLVYGLPFQHLEVFSHTLEQVGRLRPDRVALYSYAHVPWKMKSQRGYKEEDLPGPIEKMALQQAGREHLLKLGYQEIGMDHYALAADSLFQSLQQDRLHRNFMGYTEHNSSMLIGLGASSVSEVPGAYAQNEKSLEAYSSAVRMGSLPIVNGHIMERPDQALKEVIKQLICRYRLDLQDVDWDKLPVPSLVGLQEMEKEGLLSISDKELEVSPKGRRFIRNICSLFDPYYYKNKMKTSSPVFSKSI